MSPGATLDQQTGFVPVDLQPAGQLRTRTHGPHHVLRLLQGRDAAEVLTWRVPTEVDLQIAGRAGGGDMPVLYLDGHTILEMHDDRLIHRIAHGYLQLRSQFARCRFFDERLEVCSVHVIAGANFVRDILYLERMGVGPQLGHERADARHANQVTLVGQLPQRAIGGHTRHAELGDQLVFRGHAVRRAPLAGLDALEDMAFDLLVQWLDHGPRQVLPSRPAVAA